MTFTKFMSQKTLTFLMLVCFFIIAFFIFFFKAPYGLDFTDEGATLQAAYAIAHGGSFELLTTLRHSDFYNFLMYQINPDMTLLAFRYLGIFVNLLSFFILMLVLTLRVNIVFAILGLSCFIFWPYQGGPLAPGYNLYSLLFLNIFFGLFYYSETLKSTHKLIDFLLGALACCLAICYATFAPILFISFIVYAIANYQKKQNSRTLWTSLGLIAVLSVFYLFLYKIGLDSWLHNINFFTQFYSRNISKFEVAKNVGLATLTIHPYGYVLLITALLLSVGMLIKKEWRYELLLTAWSFAFVLLILSALKLAFDGTRFTYLMAVTYIYLFPMTCLFFFFNKQKVNLLFFFFATGSFLTYALSTYYFNNYAVLTMAAKAMPIVYFCIVLSWYYSLRNCKIYYIKLLFFVSLLSFFGYHLLNSVFDFKQRIYRDSPKTQLTAQFKDGKLKNIYSSPARVRKITALKDVVSSVSKPEDKLLVLFDAPLLHYILERPPASTAWLATIYGDEALKALTVNLENKPKLIITIATDVSTTTWSEEDERVEIPDYIHNYLAAYYFLNEELFPFRVYTLK